MIAIDNQPVVFNQPQSCLYPSTYKQRVNQGDKTQFQFKLEVCDESPDLVTNGGFNNALSGWTQVGTGWSLGSGSTAVKAGTSSAILRQTILNIGSYYQCIIDVAAVSSSEPSDIAEVRLGSDTRFFPLEVGVNELWGRCLGTGNLDIRCNNNATMTINSVQVFAVDTNIVVTISDEEGTPMLPIYLNSPTDPYYNVDNFILDGQFVTCTIDWNALSVGPGCYTIGVIDPCTNEFFQNLCNYHFDQGKRCWTNINDNFIVPDAAIIWGVAISPGGNGYLYLIRNFGGSGGANYIYNDNVLENGVSYIVNYRVTAFTGTDFSIVNGTLSDSVSGTNTVFNVDQETSLEVVSGTFTGVITPTVDNSVIAIRFDKFGSGGTTASVDYISVIKRDIITTTNDFISNKFRLGNHECTRVLSISNDQPAFGFSFRYFTPQIRIRCDMIGGADRSEREWVRYSSGQKKNVFADVIFAEDLVTELLPDYIHRFLKYCTKSNYFYIDGVSYFFEDDEYPDISWNKQKSDGTVTLEVSENGLQLLQNCTGQVTGGDSSLGAIGSGGSSSSGGTAEGTAIGGDGIYISTNRE